MWSKIKLKIENFEGKKKIFHSNKSNEISEILKIK
jgi:hypothetical protein